MQYERKILQALLDSYENSLLSRGENKVAVHISFPFTRKSMPSYFDESSLAFEEIHGAAKHLEELGLVRIQWKGGKEGHIIQKVVLNEEHIWEVYHYVKRTPKRELAMEQIQVLQQLSPEGSTPVAGAFAAWLRERLEEGKSVKEYVDLEDREETKRLITAISSIEKNQEESYIREFSVKCFGDTKMLEKRLGLIGKIMRRFSDRYEGMDNYAILAEHGIYHTPNYVYVKGWGRLYAGKDSACSLDLKSLRQGIGLSGEDLDTIRWTDLSEVKKVITIENLTTFFRWEEENSILIYLGGYHNHVRRKLLQNIHAMLPDAEYLHFGDIDVGGFEIYRDLLRRTGIVFVPYLMGIEQLKTYREYTRALTENDRKRLGILLEKEKNSGIAPVLEYMGRYGVKLEQECIRMEK